jgi:hypothetical protein
VVSPGSAEQALLGSRTELGVGTVLSIDRTSASASSAELQLFDKSRLKILAGASVALTRMEVGRFINQQWLALDHFSGPIQYQTVVPIEVRVPNGVVHLGGNGDYTVWIDGDVSRVLVYAGEARLVSGGAPVVVPEGKRGEIDRLGGIRLESRQMVLLPNGNFVNRVEGWHPHDVPNNALDVNGARLWVSAPDDSSTALRVVRETRKREHGETGLIQKFERDVSGFRHLYLRAWVRVDYAELSGGGQFGSEYPMMLKVVYEGPAEASDYPWAVGFYYANPENRPVPQSVGVMWPHGMWQRYEVDLKDMPDEASLPYYLRELTVMGQGHSYDARIAGIELIGD